MSHDLRGRLLQKQVAIHQESPSLERIHHQSRLQVQHLGFESDTFDVKDLLDGKTYTWHPHTFVKLNPGRPDGKVAHIAYVDRP
jgi:hypothetical protein